MSNGVESAYPVALSSRQMSRRPHPNPMTARLGRKDAPQVSCHVRASKAAAEAIFVDVDSRGAAIAELRIDYYANSSRASAAALLTTW
eukprot:5971810-Amphidinium_carterae.1